jgi:putative ABC transport system permease protein
MKGLAWTLARRDLRGGWRSFRLALVGLALGVATIAGVGSFGAGLVEGLRENGRVILGGDLALQTTMIELAPEQETWLAERGNLSQTRDLNAMAIGGDRPPLLVSLRAVDDLWPLYGEAELDPPMAMNDALADGSGLAGAVVDRSFLERMGLERGDTFTLGDGTFRITAEILAEPDRASAPFQLGPRVLIASAALDTTGLAGPGSLVRHLTRLQLNEGVGVGETVTELRETFAESGWRIRTHEDANPQLRRFLERLRMFITLVGLAALLIGGIGIASAVSTYLDKKTGTVAILKSLGGSSRLIFTTYLLEVSIMAGLGVAAGLIAGGILPLLVGELVRNALPVPVEAGVYALPLALAAAYGLLTAIVFALLPLARTRDIPPAALFREKAGDRSGATRARDRILVAGLAALLAGLAVGASDDRVLAAAFIGGAAGALLLFRLAALAIMTAAKKLGRPRWLSLRMALTGLYRPGAATPAVTVAFGIGLTVLTAVAGVQANLRHEIGATLPQDAPAFFFIDIQPDQIAPFRTLAEDMPGVQDVQSVPSLRGRITAIDGVPVADAVIAPEVRWAVDGDRGVTYAAMPPEGSELTAGDWWPQDYAGAPLVSFDAEIAAGFGLEVGETLTVNILGREITATVANLRRIDWTTMGINFTLVYAPGLLDGAPHTHIATVYAEREAESPLREAVAERFPNVSAIGVRDVLSDVLAILGRIDAAIGGIAALALIAGVIVLAESVAAAQRRRLYDAVIMKVLGATRGLLARVFTLEHLMLGLAASVLALSAGTAAAWAVVRFVLGTTWSMPWLPILAIGAVALAVSLIAGLVASWRALSPPAAPVLRTE